MADKVVGKRLRAVVDLGGIDMAAGDEFTVTEKMAERIHFGTLLATGAVEVVVPKKTAKHESQKPGGKAADAR